MSATEPASPEMVGIALGSLDQLEDYTPRNDDERKNHATALRQLRLWLVREGVQFG